MQDYNGLARAWERIEEEREERRIEEAERERIDGVSRAVDGGDWAEEPEGYHFELEP